MDFGRCQLPCSHLIVSEGQHGKRIRCVGLAHAQDAIFAISNCMYCENFTLKTLRASLAFFFRESAVLTRRVAPEASVLREAEAWSSEAQHKFSGPVFSRLSCTQPGSTRWRFLRVGGYFIYRSLRLWGLRATLSLWKFCRCIPHLTRFGEPAVVPLLVNAPVSEWI